MGRRGTTVALAAVLAFALAACGGDQTPTDGGGTPTEGTGSAPTPRATGSGPSASPIVADVLDFEAPLLSGGTLDGETLAGRDVAFWFWAPW